MLKKSCVHCKFAQYFPPIFPTFYDPGADEEIECLNTNTAGLWEQVDNGNIEFDYDVIAEHCHCYEQASDEELWERFGDEQTFDEFRKSYGLEG